MILFFIVKFFGWFFYQFNSNFKDIQKLIVLNNEKKWRKITPNNMKVLRVLIKKYWSISKEISVKNKKVWPLLFHTSRIPDEPYFTFRQKWHFCPVFKFQKCYLFSSLQLRKSQVCTGIKPVFSKNNLGIPLCSSIDEHVPIKRILAGSLAAAE